MVDGYTPKELEIMETRMAEQELEIVNLRLRLSKMETGQNCKDAIGLLDRIWNHYNNSSYYLPKDLAEDLEHYMREISEVCHG